MRVKAIVTIINAPIKLDKYTVVRRGDDWLLYYYGTYDDKNRAFMARKEIGNGILVEVDRQVSWEASE